MITPLCELSAKYNSDKSSRHNYTPVYHQAFANRRESVKKVLEIGILKGASMRMWRDYFPNAVIYGIDIDPVTLIHGEERIATFLVGQTDEKGIDTLFSSIGGEFDLIVDDGSHRSDDQIKSYHLFKKFLKQDAIYVIEDVLFPNRVVKGTGGVLVDLGKRDRRFHDNRLVII